MPKLRPPLCARLLYGGLWMLAWGTLAMWLIGGGLLMLAWGEFLGIAELGLIDQAKFYSADFAFLFIVWSLPGCTAAIAYALRRSPL
jgi:hypothetical protein